MALVFNDTTNRNGLIQWCEDVCGLGATGITSNTTLFQQFTRWINQWQKLAFNYAILSFKGWDVDDPGYSTAPTGTFAGTTNRDYNFDSSLLMLKVKQVNISYDGVNYVAAQSFDDNDVLQGINGNYNGTRGYAVNDPNIDSLFTASKPYYDLIANGFKIFPKFTASDVSAGAKVYVEFFRAPREFATSGTDSYATGLDLQFAHFPAVGASYEYCKLYKPDIAASLQGDLYGVYYRGRLIKKGLIEDLQEWYSSKAPNNSRMIGLIQNNK